jgi:hypothetical protein
MASLRIFMSASTGISPSFGFYRYSKGGYPVQEVAKIRRMVEENRELFLETWHAYFDGTAD